MDITPYPTSEKSHHSKSKVFHSPQNPQATFSLRDDSIPTVIRPSHQQLDTNHLSPTSPSDDDHQSFTSYEIQTAHESASERARTKKKLDKADTKAFVSLVEAKTPETRSRPVAARLVAHDVLARAADTPDRFIPKRSDHSIFITNHRIRKHPGDLTVNEKLHRQQECSENPFDRRPSHGILPSSLLNRGGFLQAPHMSPHLVDDQALLSQHPSSTGRRITPRQVSVGGIWNVGGSSIATRDPRLGPAYDRGDLYEDKSATPIHVARYEYSTHISSSEDLEMNQSRLAIAFDVDLIRPQLTICNLTKPTETGLSPSSPQYERFKCPLVWKDCEWKRAEMSNFLTRKRRSKKAKERIPFCILVTPGILDDFYCTVLAYSHTMKILAYAIMDIVYLWSTSTCKAIAAFPAGHPNSDHVTALSFSSPEGQKGILAVATWRGYLYLWSLVKPQPRRIWQYHIPISCVAFKQTITRRLSTIFSGTEAFVEDLVVGDKTGVIWYYCVESSPLGTLSKVTLLARIDAHCGCICGISWSPDNKYLATSGDDDACLLFDLNRILGGHHSEGPPLIGDYFLPGVEPLEADSYSMTGIRFLHIFRRLSRLATGSSLSRSRSVPNLERESSTSDSLEYLRIGLDMNQNRPERRLEASRLRRSSFSGSSISDNLQAARILGLQEFLPGLSIGPLDSQGGQTAKGIPYNSQTHRFMHRSAVKAIAFAPWQPTLLATGGGMSDRTVHFYHTPSGSCLAKIYVLAQVTGLIWSTTQREIAVILGFSEGDHPFRIAVFAWPSCEQTAAIPWNINFYGQVFPDLHVSERALAAISIPRFRCPPRDGDGDAASSADDECIAIISKEHIRFYRIWSKARKSFGRSAGILHSAILESLDGIENPGNEVIR